MTINTNTTPRPASQPQPKAERTPLQKHVDYFDRNHDGKTTVCETYSGLRALGMGRIASALAGTVINAGLARTTGAPWHSPLTVQNDNIAAAKHDSDSDIYDEKGMFVPAKFEQMFAEFDSNRNDTLDHDEITVMLDTRKESFVGRKAAGAEFGLLEKVAGPLTRETMQSFYDGNLFYKLAGENPPA